MTVESGVEAPEQGVVVGLDRSRDKMARRRWRTTAEGEKEKEGGKEGRGSREGIRAQKRILALPPRWIPSPEANLLPRVER